jgi:hypothetical protein
MACERPKLEYNPLNDWVIPQLAHMSSVPPQAIPTVKEQQRNVRASAQRMIVLPFIGGIALIVLLVAAAALLPDARQTTLIADFFMIVVLCPVVLCLFPVYMMMVLAIYGMGRINKGVSKPLFALERLTASLHGRTYAIAERVGKASITFNAKMTSIDKTVFSIFDPVEERGTPNEQSASDQPPRG